ncbi:unnamed protein product [Brassica oleracea]|uniref:(rape) hypothetical protein n=1 Tax=Brassica napus TaxID=3708 RepID=A0A816KUS1_BRANA|nr:unnamed protein product [Brassica napus]
MCNLAKIHHWRDRELSLPRLRSWTTMAAAWRCTHDTGSLEWTMMAAAWRCTHDTGSLEWTTMAAAVEELAVLGPVTSWLRIRRFVVEQSVGERALRLTGGDAVAMSWIW